MDIVESLFRASSLRTLFIMSATYFECRNKNVFLAYLVPYHSALFL